MTAARRLTSVTAVLLLVAAPSAHEPAQAPTPTFSSKVEVVRVDVLVTENGRSVVGLRPSDFDVFDNGVRQEVEFATLERMPLNVTLVVDASNSIAGDKLGHLQTASNALLDKLASDDRAALLTFNDRVTLRSPLTADLLPIRQAIRAVVPVGETALIDAVHSGMVLAEADVGRNLLIVFTDGIDTSSYMKRQEVAETARTTDVVTYGVTSGTLGGRSAEFLGEVAERTGGRVLTVDSTNALQAAFVGILDEFRHRYLLTYSPRNVSKTGWHHLEVRLKGRRAAIKARPGYQAGS